MLGKLSRWRSALCWLVLLAGIGCQPVREDRAINFQRNGDQVAFQHGNNGVFVAGQKGGAPTKIFQPDADVVATSSPLWSPTDKRLLFTTAKRSDDRPKNDPRLGGEGDPAGNLFYAGPTIYTCWLREEEKDGKSPPPVPIFHAACDHPGYVAANLAARWHPDGKRVLFVAQSGEHAHSVFEFDLQTKTSRRVFNGTAEAIVFDWAPDNKHLVCVLGSQSRPRVTDGIWIGTSGGNNWWQVPESTILAQGELPAVLEKLRATKPVWSKQGDRFAFVRSQLQNVEINAFAHRMYLVTPGKRAVVKIAESDQPIRDVRWAPNGDRVGYINGQEEGPLNILRLADKSSTIFVPIARAFLGWDDKNTLLAYVAADPVPHSDDAAWAFLLMPEPRLRDAIWLAPADGSSRGEKVFAGMQITFPQWSPDDAKMSLWATFNPSYRSTTSVLLEVVAFYARLEQRVALNGLRVRPGDPALLFDPKNGKIAWMPVNAHEQIQVGHFYLMKREYDTAWQWYEKANQDGKPEVLRESLFYQYYCLTKLGRAAEAKEKLALFERDFWAKLPKLKKDGTLKGDGFAEIMHALADPNSALGKLTQDFYIAEAFLSVDAAEDGEAFFHEALKNAPTDEASLSKAVVLSQFLLLMKKRHEYLELVQATLLPLLLDQDVLPVASRDQSRFRVGHHKAVLPLCDPEFVKAIGLAPTRSLLASLVDLRKTALNDRQRLWLDVMAQAAHRRLGQMIEAGDLAKRIAGNPERLDAWHGNNVVALIAETRRDAKLREVSDAIKKLDAMIR